MSRLSRENWIAAGFRALTMKGPQALKAEPLARDLGTTKGSFYWHFKDVPTFQADMLAYWEEHATQDVITRLDAIPIPEMKLRKLADLATHADAPYAGVDVEPAVRAWAKADMSVADAVQRVDEARLAYLERVFQVMKLTNADLPRLFYAGFIGLKDLARGDASAAGGPLSTLTDLMIALSETD